MAAELLQLKALLVKYLSLLVQDAGLIDRAVLKLQQPRNEVWEYDMERLTFQDLNLERGRVEENASVELTIEISGPCKTSEEADMLKTFCLRFVLNVRQGKTQKRSAFRFERHLCSDGDGEPEFAHPLYHFQYGGRELTEDDDFDKGQVFFPDAPRLKHPPMDLVLAVDFVLNQFYSRDRAELGALFGDTGYKKLVEKARERFWKPYFLGVAGNFILVNHKGQTPPDNVKSAFSKNLFRWRP